MSHSPTTSKVGLKGFRLTLILLCSFSICIGVSFWFGQLFASKTAQNVESLQSTLRKLEHEHALVLQQKHQLQARTALAELEYAELHDQLATLTNTVTEQATSLSFYQNVMAPETIQNRFIVDGLQVFAQQSKSQYKMEFVLLQRLKRRSLIKGDLEICLEDVAEQIVCSGSKVFLPEGDIEYGFKFFQAVSVSFSLPDNFEPTAIVFSSQVYQYSKKREDYRWKVAWKEVFSASP
ncbi:DUF6776 family protein [Alteromonas lipotrueiana]|uniref:DUF6776 family protein n=1 Tax=Alteromonas lipotrueiana TaxID=2803815 RepID=UPI001C43DD03|nr:DUF6776 family protein [Alteromonas lipotrueiana]